jgi:hypothetical protein
VRTFVPWIDELVAGYLFAAAVRAAGDRALAQRVAAWDALRRAGAADARLPLAAFAGGSSRTHWPRVWWVQGTVAEPAARLADEHGWGFARALAERLPEAGGDAEAVAALLTDLDPGVEAWHVRVMRDDRPEPARPAPPEAR